MNFLNVILMAVMALGLIHCATDSDPGKPEEGKGVDSHLVEGGQLPSVPLILVHNASNDEDVYYSLNGSADKGFIVEPGACLKFSAQDLGNLIVWATSGGIAYIGEPTKVLCGGDTPCEGGNYEITDTAWTLWDSYSMEAADEEDEEVNEASCLAVNRSQEEAQVPEAGQTEEFTEDGKKVLS